MRLHSGPVFEAVDRGLLSCASFLVPKRQRAEWHLEWESELWHVRRSQGGSSAVSWRIEHEIVLFCLGAFRDAAFLRRISWKERPRFAPFHGSAMQCLFALGAILIFSYMFSIWSPSVRATRDFSSDSAKPGTVLIQDAEADDGAAPTMSIDQVRLWERSKQRYADGFAFYRVSKESVQPGLHAINTWRVAQASANLFAVAGWSLHNVDPHGASQSSLPRLVLSERIWRQQFEANPAIAGTVLLIGSRPARVVGIAPGDTWRLPGNTDAWLLESDSEVSRSIPGYSEPGFSGPGYVVAHLTRSGRSEMWGGLIRINSNDSHKLEHTFLGKSLEEPLPTPLSIYWFAILLACLALPALASVSLEEYCFSSRKPSRIHRIARFSFLCMKIAMVMSIAYFSAVDLAYSRASAFVPTAAYIQLVASFAICLFGIRWALLDQHQRCPVCLKRVTHPAQVGSLSRMFLAWSGTELICTSGHTLLHVPGLPTSWFGAQRWMYLDASWTFLFAG